MLFWPETLSTPRDQLTPNPAARATCHILSMMKNIGACKLTWVTLDSPLGKIHVSGCEEGVHDISIQAVKGLTEGYVRTLPAI
ncbi:methylated-DNA-protein-cysteine methyltransferase [Arapaima gigas]